MTINDLDTTSDLLVLKATQRLLSDALRMGDLAVAKVHAKQLLDTAITLRASVDRLCTVFTEPMGS